MSPLERSPERDAALDALVAHVPRHGFTRTALRAALSDLGTDPAASVWLFLDRADMIEAYLDLADRRMAEAAGDLSAWRLSERVRRLIATRLALARDQRETVRRGLGQLALPGNAGAAARSLARTVDAIWHAAGDGAADFSWYTKRASLAAIYLPTLLYWLNQDPVTDPDDTATLAFLDRRLATLGQIGKLRRALTKPGGWRHATRRAA